MGRQYIRIFLYTASVFWLSLLSACSGNSETRSSGSASSFELSSEAHSSVGSIQGSAASRSLSSTVVSRSSSSLSDSSSPSSLSSVSRIPQWQYLDTSGSMDVRHEAAFVEVNGLFYSLGGRGIDPVDIFDPTTGRWSQGAKPPFSIHHFQAVVFDNKIYIVGAMTGGFPREPPVERVVIYDPEIDSWSQSHEIPENRRRGGAGAVLHEGLIYLVSGITNGHWDGHVRWLDSYNPVTGEWRQLPDAPRARDHFQAAIIDGKLYAAGGRRSSAKTRQTFQLVVGETDVYDFETQDWEVVSQLPTPRAGTSTVVVNEQLLVIGGESTQRVAHNNVEAFDPSANQWQSLPTLNRGRHGTGAIVFDGFLWTCCGSGNRGGGPELDTLERILINDALFEQPE